MSADRLVWVTWLMVTNPLQISAPRGCTYCDLLLGLALIPLVVAGMEGATTGSRFHHPRMYLVPVSWFRIVTRRCGELFTTPIIPYSLRKVLVILTISPTLCGLRRSTGFLRRAAQILCIRACSAWLVRSSCCRASSLWSRIPSSCLVSLLMSSSSAMDVVVGCRLPSTIAAY